MTRKLILLTLMAACGPAAIDSLAPPDTSLPPATPNARVEWLVAPPDTLQIDTDKAILYGFPYRATLPDVGAGGALSITRCWTLAGIAERCQREDLALMELTEGAAKFEVDPSVYHVGHNTYRLVLAFERGAQTDSAELAFAADVSACSSCRVEP